MPIFDGKTTNPDEIHSDTNFIRMNAIRDEPDPNNYYGGQVSAPIVGNLSEFMLSNDYQGGKN